MAARTFGASFSKDFELKHCSYSYNVFFYFFENELNQDLINMVADYMWAGDYAILDNVDHDLSTKIKLYPDRRKKLFVHHLYTYTKFYEDWGHDFRNFSSFKMPFPSPTLPTRSLGLTTFFSIRFHNPERRITWEAKIQILQKKYSATLSREISFYELGLNLNGNPQNHLLCKNPFTIQVFGLIKTFAINCTADVNGNLWVTNFPYNTMEISSEGFESELLKKYMFQSLTLAN